MIATIRGLSASAWATAALAALAVVPPGHAQSTLSAARPSVLAQAVDLHCGILNYFEHEALRLIVDRALRDARALQRFDRRDRDPLTVLQSEVEAQAEADGCGPEGLAHLRAKQAEILAELGGAAAQFSDAGAETDRAEVVDALNAYLSRAYGEGWARMEARYAAVAAERVEADPIAADRAARRVLEAVGFQLDAERNGYRARAAAGRWGRLIKVDPDAAGPDEAAVARWSYCQAPTPSPAGFSCHLVMTDAGALAAFVTRPRFFDAAPSESATVRIYVRSPDQDPEAGMILQKDWRAYARFFDAAPTGDTLFGAPAFAFDPDAAEAVAALTETDQIELVVFDPFRGGDGVWADAYERNAAAVAPLLDVVNDWATAAPR